MKKILIVFLVGVVLVSFISCGKDSDVEDTLAGITQAANVKITSNGADNEYKFSTAVASVKNSASSSLTTIAASNVTSQKPSMAVLFKGTETGSYSANISLSSLIGLNFSEIFENTVIIYLSEEEYVFMTKGSIEITSYSDNSIQGSFSGAGINGKEYIGLNASDSDLILKLTNLLLTPPYIINGTFKTMVSL